MVVLPEPLVFEWDSGNGSKNLKKHRVTNEECEEIFFDPDKKITKDLLHSGREERCILIGATKKARIIFTVFTMRRGSVRIISARDLNRKEQKLYENET